MIFGKYKIELILLHWTKKCNLLWVKDVSNILTCYCCHWIEYIEPEIVTNNEWISLPSDKNAWRDRSIVFKEKLYF